MSKNKQGGKLIRFNGFPLRDIYGNYIFNKDGFGIWVKTGIARDGYILINEASTIIEFNDAELGFLFPKETPK